MSDRTFLQRAWYETCKDLVFLSGVGYFHTRYFNRRNVPRTGPVLMVANHQSHLDPPLVASGAPRQMGIVARQTLFEIPILGPLIATLGAIPIDRDGMGIAGLKESLRRMKRGDAILIFPEGTRSPDGEIRTFRPGFTSLATRTGATIVPAAIEGAYRAWPKNAAFPLRRPVAVCYGQPILPADVAALSDRDLVAEIERRVRECQQWLRKMPQFRREYEGVGD